MYGPGEIPILSIVFMLLSIILSVGVPIIVAIIIARKQNGKVTPFFIGMGTFVVFALGLEQLSHLVFLKLDWAGSRFILGNAYAYATYGAMAASVFEEFGRLFAFTIILKKYREKSTPYMYGAGHGGVEAMYIGGISMLNNLIVAGMLYFVGLDEVLKLFATSGQVDLIRNNLLQLYTMSPAMFLVTGIERMLAFALHIGLSVLVYYAVVGVKKKYLFLLALLMHFATDFPAALYQYGVIRSIWLIEGWCLICVIITWILVKLFALPNSKNTLKEQADTSDSNPTA